MPSLLSETVSQSEKDKEAKVNYNWRALKAPQETRSQQQISHEMCGGCVLVAETSTNGHWIVVNTDNDTLERWIWQSIIREVSMTSLRLNP